MAGEWRDTTLGEFVRLQRGHDLTEVERRPGQVPIMGSAGHNGLHDTAKATGPGVVIGRSGVGSMGVVTYCPTDYWPHNTVLYVTDFLGNDERFTYYFLHHLNLRRFDSGSAQASLNRNYIYPIRIRIPHPTEQRAIAHILGTLDDKIQLNRRMNETLEAMARGLFKSWFIDFDPVRRNADRGRNQPSPRPTSHPSPNGRGDGDEGVVAGEAYDHLFPDSFEDSELGEVPTGWRLAPLPDVIDVNPTRALRKGVEAPYLDMANMPTRGHSPDEVVDRAFGSGMRFANGDTLVARITPCLENGKTAFVDFLEAGEVGWGSTEYIVLRPKPPLPDEFAYCLARSSEFRDFAIQRMTGSSGRQRVPAESLSHFCMVIAPKPVAELFGQLIKPLFARSSAASKEGRTLAALRDTLLPKLISGELRVKDAERTVERTI